MIQKELELRDQGMTLSALNNSEILSLCRGKAVEIAKVKGEVSIDDVREVLGLEEGGPWTGSVFKEKGNWLFIKYIPARHKGSHARPIGLWRLK